MAYENIHKKTDLKAKYHIALTEFTFAVKRGCVASKSLNTAGRGVTKDMLEVIVNALGACYHEHKNLENTGLGMLQLLKCLLDLTVHLYEHIVNKYPTQVVEFLEKRPQGVLQTALSLLPQKFSSYSIFHIYTFQFFKPQGLSVGIVALRLAK